MRATLATVLLVAACGGGPTEEEIERARTTAQGAAGRLVETLMGELMTALANGPPESALDVCARKAQDLTAGIVEETGAEVRRTALRLRNPRNAPDAYERAWLERAAKQHARGEAVETSAEVVGSELRFMKPIVLVALCTQCHGREEGLSEGVREALLDRYPDDEATGYAAGDFRGAVSVRVPLR